MARLKVFRTAIGFHDAYVAATSRKAALEAWGSDKDLFAMGAAEVVTDPKLTAEPLAAPGEVVRKTRGSLSEHLTAAGKQAAPKARKPAKPEEPAPAKKREAKPKPRPSRDKLDAAEAAVADVQAQADAETAEFDRREAALRKERRALEEQQRKALARAEKQRDQAKARYDAALERWRADD